jgi:O-antigen ligase
LKTSAVVRFAERTLGFELRYDFFKNGLTQGGGRLAIALIFGAAAGAAGAVKIILAPLLICAFAGMSLVMYAPITGVFFAVLAAPFVPTMVLAALCLLTIGSLLIKSLAEPYFKWRFDGMGLALAFLLLIFLVSSITSFAVVNSLTVWCMYLVFMGFYFVIINSVKSHKQIVGLLRVFVLAGALVALYGVMQYVFGWNTSNAWIDETMFENDTMRVYSTLENPNVLGEYLLLVLPISAVFMCRHKCAELSKWVYAAITAVLFLCLILTQSRGCWLGFMLAAVIFVTFTNGRLWGLVPIALLILPFVVPQTIVDRLMSIGNMDDSSTSYRVFIWFGTIAMLRDFFIGGIGMGEKAFNSVYPFYSYNAIIAPHSHNLYLQLVTESGIAALAVFIACMVIFIRRMTSVYDGKRKTCEGSMLAVGFISGLAGFLLQSMFDYTFYNYRVMAMFFMFLAMGMAYKYVTDKANRSSV